MAALPPKQTAAQGSPGLSLGEPLARIARLAAAGVQLDAREMVEIEPYCALLDTYSQIAGDAEFAAVPAERFRDSD
jgi:hypothetical protein